mmetsp:Transcript_82596/g.157376  ORF Transcript_82596/g.157376 Transcript_82596/m.157376 type:complete len:192 (+) Transcript_82596:66-641(+)
MSVDMSGGGASTPDGGSMGGTLQQMGGSLQQFGQAGSARALAAMQSISSSMPSSVKAIPGDPVIAQRVGCAAGIALLAASLLGILRLQSSALAKLVNFYALALAVMTLVLETEIPQVALPKESILGHARCFSKPQGLAGFYFVQSSLAFAQESVLHFLAAFVALMACALDLAIWYARRSAIVDDDTTLIAG